MDKVSALVMALLVSKTAQLHHITRDSPGGWGRWRQGSKRVYEANPGFWIEIWSFLGIPQKMFLRQLDEFFEIEEKIITMTCIGFSGSSDACSPRFSILGRSYVADFFYLASKCYTKMVARRTWFFATPAWLLILDLGSSVRAGVSGVSETI